MHYDTRCSSQGLAKTALIVLICQRHGLTRPTTTTTEVLSKRTPAQNCGCAVVPTISTSASGARRKQSVSLSTAKPWRLPSLGCISGMRFWGQWSRVRAVLKYVRGTERLKLEINDITIINSG